MIQTLLYHRVGEGKYSNSLQMFDKHFSYIAEHYPTLFPGEAQKFSSLHLCLTFDDATYDFYHFIYPLLCKYRIKALLAVPTAYIQKKSTLLPQERLQLLNTFSLSSSPKEVFCSFEELQELAQSPWVQLASHSHHHRNLTKQSFDPSLEFELSKSLIEKNTQAPCQTFVYPYGKTSAVLQKKIREFYRYQMRIGSSLNLSWETPMIYRIPADCLLSEKDPFLFKNQLKYLCKSPINYLRDYTNHLRQRGHNYGYGRDHEKNQRV